MKNSGNLGVLVLLLVLIGAVVFFNGTINPLRNELAVTRLLHADERIAADERVRRGQEAEARYADLERRIQEDERQYQSLLATLPTRRDAGALLGAIEDAASDSGARLTEITPDPTETPLSTDVVFTSVRLRAEGTYTQVRALLERLEALPRSARLTRVALNRQTNSDWRDPTLALEATLETYLYRSGGAQHGN